MFSRLLLVRLRRKDSRDLIGRIHIHLARAQASYTYFHNTALVHSEVKNNQTHIHTHSTVLRIFKVAQVIGIVLLVLVIYILSFLCELEF